MRICVLYYGFWHLIRNPSCEPIIASSLYNVNRSSEKIAIHFTYFSVFIVPITHKHMQNTVPFNYLPYICYYITFLCTIYFLYVIYRKLGTTADLLKVQRCKGFTKLMHPLFRCIGWDAFALLPLSQIMNCFFGYSCSMN